MKQFPELEETADGSGSVNLPSPGGSSRSRADPRAFGAEEIAALRAALERHNGSVASAAAELGISRQRAFRMMKSKKVL